MEYVTAHAQIYRIRGKATEYKCINCDNLASQWAYNHQDPNELVGIWDGRLTKYSEDPEFYNPMCARCHVQHDNNLRGRSGNGKELRTHCPENHEFTDANTRIDKKGVRHCKTCHREKERARYKKLRASGMTRYEIRGES